MKPEHLNFRVGSIAPVHEGDEPPVVRTVDDIPQNLTGFPIEGITRVETNLRAQTSRVDEAASRHFGAARPWRPIGRR